MNEINLFDAISLCDYKKDVKNFFFDFLQIYINEIKNIKIEFYLYKKKFILFRYFLRVNYKNEIIPIKLLLYFLKNLDEKGIELYLENFDNFVINDYYKDKLISKKSLKIKYQNFIKFEDYEGNLLNFLNDLMDYLYSYFSEKFPLFRIHGNEIQDYGKMCIFNKKNLIKINIGNNNDNNNNNNIYNNDNYNNNNNNYNNDNYNNNNNYNNNQNNYNNNNYNNNQNNYNNNNNNYNNYNYNYNNNNNNNYNNNNQNNYNNNYNYNNHNNNNYNNNYNNNNNNNFYNNNNNHNYNNNNNYNNYNNQNFEDNKNLIEKSTLLLNKMNVQINDDQLFLSNNLIDDDVKNSFLFLNSYINNSNNNNLQNNNNNKINLEEKRKKEELETFNIIKNQTFNSIVDELTIKFLNLDETKKMLLNKIKNNNNEYSNLLEKNNELNQQKNLIKNDIKNLLNYKNVNLNNIYSYLLFSKNVDKLIEYETKINTLNDYLTSLKKLILNRKIPFEKLIIEYRINSRFIFYLKYKYFSLLNSELKKINFNC